MSSMKAVVFHGIGDIRLDDVPDPRLEEPTDAIVRLTASAICGTDLHLVRGTFPGVKPGRILGHEGVGVVEELGPEVRNFDVGDRVVIASSIACGRCAYCRVGYFAQCDVANPNGPLAGTCFFGGPEEAGGVDGLQAERARVPFAHVTMVKVPDEVSDDEALLLSDIFPTAYMAAELAEIRPGNTVCVFGCGPVGLLAIVSARLLGAGRILAVDCVESRLRLARGEGAETIDYAREDPVETVRRLTGGAGVDRAIDAVGIDANRPHSGPGARAVAGRVAALDAEQRAVAAHAHPVGDNWHPGDAPSLALEWAVDALCKAGSLSVIGVYSELSRSFPIGRAMDKNLTVKGGNCHHRRYIPRLLDLVASGAVDPSRILTQREALGSAIEAYRAFDRRTPHWVKVELAPTLV